VGPRDHTTVEFVYIPSRELAYLTWGKGKSSSIMPLAGDMLVPRRVINAYAPH